MATILFVGDAPEVAEVATVQITAYDAATTYTLTLNGKTVSVAGTTDADGTASALSTAWNASTEPEFAEITASVATDTVTLTHDTVGREFSPFVTSSVNGGTGTIGAVTQTTAASGPNVVTANNFKDVSDDSRGLPVNNDTLVFRGTDVDLTQNLDALTGVTLTELIIEQSYTGKIGLPDFNEENSKDYSEYRERFLEVNATNVLIGRGEGSGSPRVKLNLQAAQTTVNIIQTGVPTGPGEKAVHIKGTHASNEINVISGSVAIADNQSEASTFSTVRVSYLDDQDTDSDVRIGDNVTLTNVYQLGGTLEVKSDTTLYEISGGTGVVYEGAHTEINVRNATLDYRGNGTITTLDSTNSLCDFSNDPRPVQITNPIELRAASIFRDPLERVTKGSSNPPDITLWDSESTIERAPGTAFQVVA